MHVKHLATSALSLCLIYGASAIAGATPPSGSAPAFGQERGWEMPPPELNEMQRRGFHDGVEGARHDMENHRNPDFNNREEYRNADFPPGLRDQYRDGFRRGYQLAVSRMMGGQPQPMQGPPPGPPPGPPQSMPMQGPGWGRMPDRYGDMHRRGFQDGVDGAQKDMGNHRRPDPNNRDEYRSPNVPPQFADDYREGFRRGYEQTVAQMMGVVETGQWDAPPGVFQEVQRQGFRDGIEGARKDAGNRRRPDPNNRDEYRDPHVAPEFREAYQEGFRLGYERAAAHEPW